jgi:hypothetical protein
MKKSILWASIALAFLVVGCIVDITFYYDSYIFLTIACGVGVAFFTFMAVCNFDSIMDLYTMNDPSYTEEYEKAQKYAGSGFVLAALAFLASSFILVTYNNHREEKAFANEGVMVTGTIVNGRETVTTTKKLGSSTNSSSFDIEIQFKTTEGKVEKITKNVSSQEFQNAYQGQPVALIYYKPQPSMVKLLMQSQDLKKYKKIDDRGISTADIEKIWNMPIDSIKPEVLDKIALDWQYVKTNEYEGFENKSKKEAIVIQKGTIIYVTEGVHNRDFRAFLKPLVIEKETELPATLFESETKPRNEIDAPMTLQDSVKMIDTKSFQILYHFKHSQEFKSKSNGPISIISSYISTFAFSKKN